VLFLLFSFESILDRTDLVNVILTLEI